MASIVQSPAPLNLQGVAGSPFLLTLNITLKDSNGDIVSWGDADEFVALLEGLPSWSPTQLVEIDSLEPTLANPTSGVITLSWSTAQTQALSQVASGRWAFLMVFEEEGGPFSLVGGSISMGSPTTPGSSTSTTESLTVDIGTLTATLNVTVGGAGGGGGGGATVLSLSYDGHGPFDVPVFSLPAGWDGTGDASMGAQLTIGTNIASGLLHDQNGDSLPDGFTFTAFIFVINSTIFDIIAVNTYATNTLGVSGILSWGATAGEPTVITPNYNGDGIYLSTPSTSGNGIQILDNGTAGITIVALGSSGVFLAAEGDGAEVGLFTSGGNATGGINIQTQATDTDGITLIDDSGVGIEILATKVAIGNHGTASGNDSVAIGDSALAYSADQTVVASTNAQTLGLGSSQHSVIVGQIQSTGSGTFFLNTCVGANILQLLDAEDNPIWDRTIAIHAVVVARRVDTPGTDSAWQADCVLRGDGTGTYAWLGGSDPVFTVIAQDAAAADWQVGLQIDGPFLEAPVEADDGTTVNWEITLTLDEVAG